MTLHPTPLSGVYVVESLPFEDARGAFRTTWDAAEFADEGVTFQPGLAHLSHNVRAGTLRGMHFQKEPHGQPKLVACARGEIFDVVIDLRPGSPTFRQWHGERLSETNGRMLFVPRGFAHGFATLRDETTVSYLIEGEYRPESAGAVRWNDPAFGIVWPVETPHLSDRDRDLPDFVG